MEARKSVNGMNGHSGCIKLEDSFRERHYRVGGYSPTARTALNGRGKAANSVDAPTEWASAAKSTMVSGRQNKTPFLKLLSLCEHYSSQYHLKTFNRGSGVVVARIIRTTEFGKLPSLLTHIVGECKK